MTLNQLRGALRASIEAARASGALMRRNWHRLKRIHSQEQHDIKLELDVRCQMLIEQLLSKHDATIPVLGEEGSAQSDASDYRWVVDPIDGTVNFAYGIPHACVSIALQGRESRVPSAASTTTHQLGLTPDGFVSLVGVVFDPFCDELWTAIIGQKARANGRVIQVSGRRSLEESIVSIGFAKSGANLRRTLPYFNKLAPKARKIRIMGSAALALTYVAQGRFDAYVEGGVRLWDVAAGGLIVECAGGEFWREPLDVRQHVYRLVASNGRLRQELSSLGSLPKNPI